MYHGIFSLSECPISSSLSFAVFEASEAMHVKRLLWESKLALALVLLIAARCVDRVLYTWVSFSFNVTRRLLESCELNPTIIWDLRPLDTTGRHVAVVMPADASHTTTRRSSGTSRTWCCRSRS